MTNKKTAAMAAALAAVLALGCLAGCTQDNNSNSSNASNANSSATSTASSNANSASTANANDKTVNGANLTVENDPVAIEQKAQYEPGTYSPETGYVNPTVGIKYPVLDGFEIYDDGKADSEFTIRQPDTNSSVAIIYSTPLGQVTLDDFIDATWTTRKQKERSDFKVDLGTINLLGEPHKVITTTAISPDGSQQLITAQTFFEGKDNVVVISAIAPSMDGAMSLLAAVQPA